MEHFEITAATILDIKIPLPFLNHLTNVHQNWFECYDLSLEYITNIENDAATKFSMAATAILNYEKRLAVNHLTNLHQIWNECYNHTVELHHSDVNKFKMQLPPC